MAKNDTRQHLENAFQRHIDTGKAFGGVLMALSGIELAAVHFFMDVYNITRPYYLFGGIGGLILGFILILWYMSKQEIADTLNERLYAVWHYEPSCIYSFNLLQSRYTKPARFYNGLVTTGVILILTLLLRQSETTFTLSYVSLVCAGISLLFAIIVHPYTQYLLLKLRTFFLGDAKEIIFSRAGIWYCGKVYNFGHSGITYHRVERAEFRGRDAIVFYYTQTRGYQASAKELWIPVSKKMAYAADALVAEFNRSDLLFVGAKSFEK